MAMEAAHDDSDSSNFDFTYSRKLSRYSNVSSSDDDIILTQNKSPCYASSVIRDCLPDAESDQDIFGEFNDAGPRVGVEEFHVGRGKSNFILLHVLYIY